MGSPSLLIVGKVAQLQHAMRWYDAQPLFAKRVLVTRPRHQLGPTAKTLRLRGAQVIAHSVFADTKRNVVPLCTMRRGVSTGVKAHSARAANWRLHIGVGEPNAHRGNPIEIRRGQMGMTRATQIIMPKLVIHDEKDVQARLLLPRSLV